MNKQEKALRKLVALYELYMEELAEYNENYPAAETQGSEGPGSNPPPPPPPPPLL